MNNQELESILKSAPVPERSTDYWDDFPDKVRLALQQRARISSNAIQPARSPRLLPALGFGVALASVAFLLLFHFSRTDHQLLTVNQLTSAAKYFREIQPLFPNQLKEIAFDKTGAQLLLADQPDVPASQPYFIKICVGNQCRSFITFSGQEIRLDGQTFQVLADRQGAVMVMGEQWVWSSSTPDEKPGRYRIAARPLPTT